MNDSIEVSILCATYNQAAYIEDALDSFLGQETSFAFEVLVHDDASTDGTQEILRSYEERYPGKVRVQYEEVNQFEKQLIAGGYFQNGLEQIARGRYLATCEGDDYWTDKGKLQAQYDYMEAHPECVCCGHKAIVVDARNDDSPVGSIGYGEESCDLTAEQIISGFSLQTATLFYRTGFSDRYLQEWPLLRVVGDYPWVIFLSQQGTIHYDKEARSAYRSMAVGSHSSESDQDKLILRYKQLIRLHLALDDLTDRRYTELFLARARQFAWLLAVADGCQFFAEEQNRNDERFKRLLPFSQRIKTQILRLLSGIKRTIVG